ncbi:MAG: phospholipid/cholesterol/gamma-HCH transport system ATP-binding protein, partial [Actinomycetota bacterium]|nr:phospholipid/cholesterol/gamma-HCH transport system ATP-binding protein [Actinomycetota bacterium]
QINPTEGIGERKAVERRKDRVMQILHTLPEKAQTAILESLTDEDMERYGISKDQDRTELIEVTRDNPPEDADPFGYQAMQEAQSESMVEGSPAGEGEGEGEKAGSWDPNADAEARKAPPDPPESDEPLVGVPVDEYAGGTVVLPQAGEHTKSEDEKSGADGADGTDQGDSDEDRSGDQDQDSDGQDQASDGDDQDTQVHQQQSDQDRDQDGSDRQDTQVHQQSGQQDRDDDQDTAVHQQSAQQDQGPGRDQGVRLEEAQQSGPRHAADDNADQHTEEIPLPTQRDVDGDGQASDSEDRKPSPHKRDGGLRRLFNRS